MAVNVYLTPAREYLLLTFDTPLTAFDGSKLLVDVSDGAGPQALSQWLWDNFIGYACAPFNGSFYWELMLDDDLDPPTAGIYFDGSSALGLPDLANINDYTIACAFKPDDGSGDEVIFAFDDYPTSPRNASYYYFNDNPPFSGYWSADGTGADISPPPAPAGAWNTIVKVRSGGVETTWLNGTQVSPSIVGAAGPMVIKNLRVGCLANGSPVRNTAFFRGYLDQFTLYGRAWSPTEIAAYATNPVLSSVSATGRIYGLPLTADTHEVAGATVTVFGTPGPRSNVVPTAGTWTQSQLGMPPIVGSNPAGWEEFAGAGLSLSSSANAAMTYTFSNVPPGTHSLYSSLLASDPTWTRSALHTIRINGAALPAIAVDCTVDRPYHRPLNHAGGAAGNTGQYCTKLGSFTISGTTPAVVTIAITNGGVAGSILPADALGLVREPATTLTATVTGSAGWASAGSPLPPLGPVTASALTQDQFYPFDPTLDRSGYKVGTHIGDGNSFGPAVFYADRAKNLTNGGSGLGFANAQNDAAGYLTGVAQGQTAYAFVILRSADWISKNFYVDVPRDGIYRAVFNYAPNASIRPAVSFDVFDGARATVGSPTFSTDAAGHTVLEQRITMRPRCCTEVLIKVHGNDPNAANNAISNLRILDPMVTAIPGYNLKTHPGLVAQLGNKGYGALRSMEAHPTNFAWWCIPSDDPIAVGPRDQGGLRASAQLPGPGQSQAETSVAIIAVEPVSHAEAALVSVPAHDPNWVKFRTAVPHNIPTPFPPPCPSCINWLDWGNSTFTWPSNIGGTISVANVGVFTPIVLDSTTFLVPCNHSGGSTVGDVVTIASAQTITNSAVYRNLGEAIPWSDFTDVCNELGINVYINIPHAASDNYISNVASIVGRRLRPDLRAIFAYSNEVWNTGFWGQWGYCLYMGVLTGVEPVGTYYGNYYAHRSYQMIQLAKTAFVAAGRPAADCLWAIEAQEGYASNSTQGIVSQLTREGAPAPDYCMVANYDPAPSSQQADARGFYERLSPEAQREQVWLAAWGGLTPTAGLGRVLFNQVHRQFLDSAGYTTTKLGAYEGDLDRIGFTSGNSTANQQQRMGPVQIARGSGSYDFHMAMFQAMSRPIPQGAGHSLDIQYEHNINKWGGPNNWNVCPSPTTVAARVQGTHLWDAALAASTTLQAQWDFMQAPGPRPSSRRRFLPLRRP